MRFLTHGLAAAGLTATVLAAGVVPAQAATTAPTPFSFTAAAQSNAASVSVDTVHAGDSVITGQITGSATTVSIAGIIGNTRLQGPVAADGSFSVSVAPFASHVRPMATLTATASDATGSAVGTTTFLVEFKTQPENPAPERDLLVDKVTVDTTSITGTATPGTTVLIDGIPNARPGAIVTKDGKYSVNVAGFALTAGQMLTAVNVNSQTLQPLGKQATFTVGAGEGAGDPGTPSDLHVDALRLGHRVVTGVAPAGSTEVAVEIYGTTQFGTVDAAGNFTINLGHLASILHPGLKVPVWVTDADGAIIETELTVTR